MSFERFENWCEAYQEAWEERDPVAAGSIFEADASYRVTPFDEPFVGREAIEEYWAEATADQRDLTVRVEPLGFDAGKGFGRFVTEYEDGDGHRVTLDGVFLVTFDGDEAISFREWWHGEES